VAASIQIVEIWPVGHGRSPVMIVNLMLLSSRIFVSTLFSHSFTGPEVIRDFINGEDGSGAPELAPALASSSPSATSRAASRSSLATPAPSSAPDVRDPRLPAAQSP
jgi:hypothetical protein